MLSKTKVNFWLDIILFNILVMIVLSGLGLWLLWPGGRGGGESLGVSVVHRSLKGVHPWAGMALLVGLVIHLTLHWRWLVCMAERFWGKTAAQARLNFSLDSLLLIVFGAVNLSGFTLWLVLTGGGYRGGRNPLHNMAFFGLTRADWIDLHLWAGLVMMVIVAVHLLLHWPWIVCSLRNYTRLLKENPASRPWWWLMARAR